MLTAWPKQGQDGAMLAGGWALGLSRARIQGAFGFGKCQAHSDIILVDNFELPLIRSAGPKPRPKPCIIIICDFTIRFNFSLMKAVSLVDSCHALLTANSASLKY